MNRLMEFNIQLFAHKKVNHLLVMEEIQLVEDLEQRLQMVNM